MYVPLDFVIILYFFGLFLYSTFVEHWHERCSLVDSIIEIL